MSDPNVQEDLEESLLQVAFSEIVETPKQIVENLGRSFRAGEVLFHEDDRSTDLYMIVEGEVRISRGEGAGAKILAVLGPGEILGEMSHFDDYPRSATATAQSDTKALILDRENFSMVFELHHKWTLQLTRSLCHRIQRTFDRMIRAYEMRATDP